MSCFTKVIYELLPQDSYQIIRNCPKCGSKSTFINTNNFRVNANGNQVDVWLIYQCEKCKHTYNLSIYERTKPSNINADEYKKFMENDVELAMEYGSNKNLFARNKAEIDLEHIRYFLSIIKKEPDATGNYIIINNPYDLKIRADRLLSEIIGISRTQVNLLVKEESICIKQNNTGHSIIIHLINTFLSL